MAYSYDDKKRWLTLQCRYYNGESNEPVSFTQEERMFWGYEQAWVEFNLSNNYMLKNINSDIKTYGITKSSHDKTPLTMKALLFSRFLHWSQPYASVDQIKDVFMKNLYTDYISRLTHKEIRTIQRTEELIKKCLYYKGENQNPFTEWDSDAIRREFWEWEKQWVEALADSYRNREYFFNEASKVSFIGKHSYEYCNRRAHEVGIPATLYAHIASRYSEKYSAPFKHEEEEFFDHFMDYYHT